MQRSPHTAFFAAFAVFLLNSMVASEAIAQQEQGRDSPSAAAAKVNKLVLDSSAEIDQRDTSATQKRTRRGERASEQVVLTRKQVISALLQEEDALLAATTRRTSKADNEKKEGWWNSWGRCAAEMTGGGMLGGLNGYGVEGETWTIVGAIGGTLFFAGIGRGC